MHFKTLHCIYPHEDLVSLPSVTTRDSILAHFILRYFYITHHKLEIALLYFHTISPCEPPIALSQREVPVWAGGQSSSAASRRVFPDKPCLVIIYLSYCIILHPTHKQCNDKPGLHDLRPHQGQCRRAAQVSWPAVQGAARVSSPSSLAGSASLAGPPARSPWCSSPRRGTLGRDSRGELDKRRCPGKSKYHIHCVNES